MNVDANRLSILKIKANCQKSLLKFHLVKDLTLRKLSPAVRHQQNICINPFSKKMTKRENHLGLVEIDPQIDLILFLNFSKSLDQVKYITILFLVQ